MKTFLRFLFSSFILSAALFYLWLIWRVLLYVSYSTRKRRYYVLLDASGNPLRVSMGKPVKMQHGQRQYQVHARDIDAASTLAQAAFKKRFKDHGHEALGDAEE